MNYGNMLTRIPYSTMQRLDEHLRKTFNIKKLCKYFFTTKSPYFDWLAIDTSGVDCRKSAYLASFILLYKRRNLSSS